MPGAPRLPPLPQNNGRESSRVCLLPPHLFSRLTVSSAASPMRLATLSFLFIPYLITLVFTTHALVSSSADASLSVQNSAPVGLDPSRDCLDGSGNRACATLICQKPVKANEEITICYIDPSLPRQERQRRLKNYCFECSCARCTGTRARMAIVCRFAGRNLSLGRNCVRLLPQCVQWSYEAMLEMQGCTYGV